MRVGPPEIVSVAVAASWPDAAVLFAVTVSLVAAGRKIAEADRSAEGVVARAGQLAGRCRDGCRRIADQRSERDFHAARVDEVGRRVVGDRGRHVEDARGRDRGQHRGVGVVDRGDRDHHAGRWASPFRCRRRRRAGGGGTGSCSLGGAGERRSRRRSAGRQRRAVTAPPPAAGRSALPFSVQQSTNPSCAGLQLVTRRFGGRAHG